MKTKRSNKKFILIFIIIFIIISLIFLLIFYKKGEKNEKYVKNEKKSFIDYPILYINLDRSTKRKEYMEEQFKKYNIKNFTKISAVNGQNIKNIEKGTIDNIQYYNIFSDIDNYRLACTLSHLKAIKYAYDKNMEYVLIIEDDCSFELIDKWSDTLENIVSKSAPKDWKILQLFTSYHCLKTDFSFYKRERDCYGMVAYLLNRKGIEEIVKKSIINNIYSIKGKNSYNSGKADIFIYELLYNAYYIGIPLFIPRNEKLSSTIGVGRDNEHIKYSNKILDLYKKSFIDYPILYINLDRSTKRKEYMEEQIKKYNIKNITRISAVDKKNIKNIEKDTLNDITFENNFKDVTKGEISCTLSHLKAIKYAYDKNMEYVLIIEDDCSFELIDKWSDTLKNIVSKSAPKDWKILQLFTSYHCLKTDFSFYKRDRECYGTVAYLLNRKGIEEIVQKSIINNIYSIKGKKINNNIVPKTGKSDRFIYELLDNVYYIGIPLFITRNEVLDSTLHKDHTSEHIETTNKILNLYKNNLVSVIILNYNRPHNLDKLIPQLVEYKNIGEIIISHGDKKTEKKFDHPKIVNETSFRNKYFSATRFYVAKQAKYNLILYLDDDILISEEELQKLIISANKNGFNNLYSPSIRFCNKNGYMFKKEHNDKNDSSILLTNLALIGKETSNKVLEKMEKTDFFNKVLEMKGNGEDILFAHTLKNNNLGKMYFVDIKSKELDNSNGYSSLNTHYQFRTQLCQELNT